MSRGLKWEKGEKVGLQTCGNRRGGTDGPDRILPGETWLRVRTWSFNHPSTHVLGDLAFKFELIGIQPQRCH